MRTDCPYWQLFRTPGVPGTNKPQGWATNNQTAEPPAGSGGAAGPTQFVTLGDATAGQQWQTGSPGQLGYQAPLFLGAWDRRPWEGVPDGLAREYHEQIQPSDGQGLTLRAQLQAGARMMAAQSHAALGVLTQTAVSVIIAAFDAPGGLLDNQGEGPPPLAPLNPVWLPNQVARMGPNIAPELAFHGHAEVDLDAWSGGSRFIYAWLWCYWVGVATPAAQQVVELTVWERPPVAVRPATISLPIATVPQGPVNITTNGHLVAAFGGWPGIGTQRFRLASVNGGTPPLNFYSRSLIGPFPNPAVYVGIVDTWVAAAGETTVRNSPAAREMANESLLAVWCATQVAGSAGGPIILSASGGGV